MPAPTKSSFQSSFGLTSEKPNKPLKVAKTQDAQNVITQIKYQDVSVTKITRAHLFGQHVLETGTKETAAARQALFSKDNEVSWQLPGADFLHDLADAMLDNELVTDADELNNISLLKDQQTKGQRYIQLIQDCARRNKLKAEHKLAKTEYEQFYRKVSNRVMGLVVLGVLMVIFVPITLASFNIATLIISALCLLPFIYCGSTLVKNRAAAAASKRQLDSKGKEIAVLREQIAESAIVLGLRAGDKKSAKPGSKPVIKPNIPPTITGGQYAQLYKKDSTSPVSLTQAEQRKSLLES